MKVILTETELKVGKYICQSVTIFKKSENEYEVHLFNIKGITKIVPVLNKFTGKQEIHWDGSKISKTLGLRKKIKSKGFDYSGMPLKPTFYANEGENYCHAKNVMGNYINYYESMPEKAGEK